MDYTVPGSDSNEARIDESAELADLQKELDTAFSDEASDADAAAIEQLIKERDEYREQMLRAMADLQNVRRRAQSEKEELRRFASENLVRDLLPVLDNFERSIAALESGAEPETVMEGVKMVDRQLRQVLETVKLTKIQAVGAEFDPAHHEAVALEASAEHEPGRIIEELQSGYEMHGRVIRAAKVKVSKAP